MLLEFDYGFFSCYTTANNRQLYYEDIQDRDVLLVTVGDSWTWGDSIDGINPDTKPDSPKRLTSIYGYHLQQLIGNCDWINLGYPGTANLWIKEVALRFLNIQPQTRYKKIILSVGLTDYGRDAPDEYGDNNKMSWLLGNDQTYESIAESIEHAHLQELHQLDNHPVISLVVGRNFTSTFPANENLITHHIPERWIDISRQHWQPDYVIPKCWTVMLPDNLSTAEKSWAVEIMMPAANQVIQFLTDCPLHYKKASKHPTEDCHQLWANHVYQYLLGHSIV
jgi:hypothetical protein